MILFIKAVGPHFLVASSAKYDDDILIQFTGDRSLKKKINRSVEPKRITVFDFDVNYDHDGENW